MTKPTLGLAVVAAFLFVVMPIFISSQVVVTLEGAVAIGGPSCPAARFTLRFTSPTNSRAVVTQTSDDGSFKIHLPVGTYYAEVLSGALPVYGRTVQIDGTTRMDVTLQAQDPTYQSTCAQPRSSPSSDFCESNYQTCLGNVQSQADCIEKRTRSCMDDCINNFHFPAQRCTDHYCNPDKGSNVVWAGSCNKNITGEKNKCSSERNNCKKIDLGDGSKTNQEFAYDKGEKSFCADLKLFINAAAHSFSSLRGGPDPDGEGEAFYTKHGISGFSDCSIWIYKNPALQPSASCGKTSRDFEGLFTSIADCTGWSAVARDRSTVREYDFDGPNGVSVRLASKQPGKNTLWVDAPSRD